MSHLRHQSYKNEDTEMEYLNNTRKIRNVKIKNNLLELEKKL